MPSANPTTLATAPAQTAKLLRCSSWYPASSLPARLHGRPEQHQGSGNGDCLAVTSCARTFALTLNSAIQFTCGKTSANAAPAIAAKLQP